MSLKYLDVFGDCRLAIQQCQIVKVCLTDDWLTKTINGLGIVSGKVVTIGQTINPRLPYTNQTFCCPTTAPATTCCPPTSSGCLPLGCTPTCPPCPSDMRLQYKMCVYNLEIDDTQFEIDPATGIPYFPTCLDTVSISGDSCIIDKLINAIIALTPPV